jgi:hypothetical protein
MINMQEEQNQIGTKQTKVELQIIPDEAKVELCARKIIFSITCDGSKLTKADSGLVEEFQEEIWVNAKITKAESGQIPDIDVSVHERCGSKLTKADSGIA